MGGALWKYQRNCFTAEKSISGPVSKILSITLVKVCVSGKTTAGVYHALTVIVKIRPLADIVVINVPFRGL